MSVLVLMIFAAICSILAAGTGIGVLVLGVTQLAKAFEDWRKKGK